MNLIHEAMLNKLQELLFEMSLLAEQDNVFNEILSELNAEQDVFAKSLDEYSIYAFIENKKEKGKGE